MPPQVSILIPAFNAERWIADTLRSALAQTWPRKEIIVVDDGSTDCTHKVARQFASPSVTIVQQEHMGAASARNAALALSQGDYIQWLDADDLLSPEKIQRQVTVLEQSNSFRTLASSPWGHFRYRTSKAQFIPSPLWSDLDPLEWLLRKWENNTHMQTATWLGRRELMEAAGKWDARLLNDDDGEYFARVLTHADAIKFVSDARVYYRISPSTRLSYIGLSHRKMDAHFLGMQLQIQYLRSLDDSERTRRACVTYLQCWVYQFYPNRLDIVESAHRLARSLGGELRDPELSWKYDWIRKHFGWSAVKQAQLGYNVAKLSVTGFWDQAMFRLQEREVNVSRL